MWDAHYLRVAQLTSQLSSAIDRKVGAVIVKDDNIISFSYNGTTRGANNATCDPNGKTFPSVLHAEAYAIGKVAKSTNSTKGATLYTTLSPCIECAKIIYMAGISRVVYGELYKYREGVDYLEKIGILVNKEVSHNDLIPRDQLIKTGLL